MNVTFDYQLSRFGASHGFVTERLTEPGLAPKRLAHRDDSMNADSKEAAFQQDMIDQMVVGGWKLGDPVRSPAFRRNRSDNG